MKKIITGAILAGGKSSRFGSDKAFANWTKKSTLIETIIDILHPVCLETLIVTKNITDYTPLADSSIKIIQDLIPEYHSLGGILTALKSAETDYVFICGCDMPFITPPLITFLSHAKGDYDAVVPFFENSLQPLCALYSKKCIPTIEHLIKKKEFTITKLFKLVNTRIISEKTVECVALDKNSFFDIDTHEDYNRAQSFALSGHHLYA